MDSVGRRVSDNSAELYYDASGNVIEELTGGPVTEQNVWSPDGMLVLRDRDSDDSASTRYSGLPSLAMGADERLSSLEDATRSVTTLLGVNGDVAARYAYTPEGEARITGAAADGSDNRTSTLCD